MTIAIAIGLIVVVLGTVAVVMVPKYLASQKLAKSWHPLLTRPSILVFIPEGSTVTVNEVNGLLACAMASLIQFGPWERSKVEYALLNLRIIVSPSSEWADSAGQKVGGQAYYTTIQVDRALTSLCHEVAHVLEFTLDGATDNAHAQWVSRGIHAADENYRVKCTLWEKK